MANPLAAFGQAFGMQPQTQSSNITEAVLNDDAVAVARFLSQGSGVNSPNEEGWTPIQVASWHDKLKAFSELLKAQPDLNIQDASGRTAVHLAAFNGSERCLRKLLHAGADADVADKHGLTALHKAAVTGRLDSMRMLLEFRADPAFASPDGLTALHLAAWKGQREALRLLTSQRGANVQPLSNDGSTPLHEAVRSGDPSCVEMLLQAGADASLADRFGRTPGDLAFASGNRALFAALYSAASKAKPAAPAVPEPEQASIPPPADFWKYLQNVAPKRAGSTPAPQPATPGGQAVAPLPGQPQVAKEEHPRKQFESWLGGVLFPQRNKASPPVATGGSPYGHVNQVNTPPPSLAAPSFNKLMGGFKGKPEATPAHTVGHVGGSTFAAHRAQAAAATPLPARPQVQPPTTGMENLTMGLEPYDAAAPPAAAAAAAAAEEESPSAPGNPLMAMMQAMGKKAQADIKTTMKAAGNAAEDFKMQHALGAKSGVGKVSTQATTGDDEAYDSDEYEEASLNKVQAGAHADAENWGEFEDKVDDWGMSGSSALTAKKHAQRLAASEGRIYTVQEAREKLEQLDLATSKAQGWLRGKDAHQRLAAMEMLISAYPPQPDAPPTVPAASAPATPTSASAEEHRTQAGNPFAMFAKGVWQQRPHRQEEERLAVQAHLQSSTAAASIAAQASGPKPLPVPEVNFFDAWKATDAFSAESMLLEDSYGKVYRADILGGTHALRVLNAALYERPALDVFLDTSCRLSHAHLVPLKGASADRGLLLYDLPESGNLLYILQTAVLPTTERLSWNSCVDIALAAASALQYLHNQPEPVAHGSMNAAMVYFDRNAVAKVGSAGLVQLCDKNAPDTKALLLKDLQSLGEMVMQLLTLNTQPIDEGMRKNIVAYIASGQHIHPSDALGWPTNYAEAFEAVAYACMQADASTDTAAVLHDAIVPALLSLRGETLQGMMKATSAPAMARTDGSYLVPASFRCPLTEEVMLDPVRAADGFVYERSAIEQWLQLGRKRSPMTNEALAHPYLIPQQEQRSSIEAWLRSQNGVASKAVAA